MTKLHISIYGKHVFMICKFGTQAVKGLLSSWKQHSSETTNQSTSYLFISIAVSLAQFFYQLHTGLQSNHSFRKLSLFRLCQQHGELCQCSSYSWGSLATNSSNWFHEVFISQKNNSLLLYSFNVFHDFITACWQSVQCTWIFGWCFPYWRSCCDLWSSYGLSY